MNPRDQLRVAWELAVVELEALGLPARLLVRQRATKSIGPWWLHITHWRYWTRGERPTIRWAPGAPRWLVIDLAPHYTLYARIGFWR